jgi:hypothetical protein
MIKKNLKKKEICHLSSNLKIAFKEKNLKNAKKTLNFKKHKIKKIKIKRGNKREKKNLTSNAARI